MILFVCTGNFCRSPMAEAILRDLLRKDGKEELYEVRSAGTWTRDGLTASSLALQAMKELGLDIGIHRSHHLTSQDIEAASLIVAMTQDHKEALSVEFPQARDKLFLLSELAECGHDVHDPSGSDSLALHGACAQEIRELLERGYSRMLELAAKDPGDT
jgi:protein-tyrosine-phosphatase